MHMEKETQVVVITSVFAGVHVLQWQALPPSIQV